MEASSAATSETADDAGATFPVVEVQLGRSYWSTANPIDCQRSSVDH